MSAPIELRPVVRWFAEQMELALRRNDWKGGWDPGSCTPSWLLRRLRGETTELARAMKKRGYNELPADAEHRKGTIVREAADVANFALMIADRLRPPSTGGEGGE